VLENKGWDIKRYANSRPLERSRGSSHITFVQATTSVSQPKHWGCTRPSPARWRAG